MSSNFAMKTVFAWTQIKEEDKVPYLKKGVAVDAFNFLSVKELNTVEDLPNSSQRFQALRRNRITSTKFESLPNVKSVAAISTFSDWFDHPVLSAKS